MANLRLLVGPTNPLRAVDLITPIADGNAGDIIMLDSSGNPVPVAPMSISVQAQSVENGIINGCCRVAQRGAYTLVNSVWGHGAVDRFDGYAYADTSVGAGTLTQLTSSTIGRTNCALHFSGVTMVGANSQLKLRHRIEAKDAQKFKNQLVSFGCKIYHNVGSAINARLEISVANAVDDFSAPVLFYTTAPDKSIANATTTSFKDEAIQLGDCSNGIELILILFCGAITTKNFYITDLQFELGSVANPIVIPSFAEVLAQCQRYYEIQGKVAGGSPGIHGSSTTGWYIGYGAIFAVVKRTVPTMVKVGTWNVNNCSQPMAVASSVAGYMFTTVITSTGPAYCVPTDSTCYITADAEFAA